VLSQRRFCKEALREFDISNLRSVAQLDPPYCTWSNYLQ